MTQRLLARLFGGAVDLLYPPNCVICGTQLAEGEKHLCATCLQRLPLIRGPRCPKCCRPIRTRGGTNDLCGACRLQLDALIDRIVAAGEYRDGLRQLIHLYKYDRHQFLASVLGGLVAGQADEMGILRDIDILVPIPLHWTRKRWRGFNQARGITRHLSGPTRIPILPARDFRRTRRTTPQVQLNAAGRTANIRGAFTVRRDERIRGKRVALVDDVLTTGATSHECARVLRRAGAVAVYLLVIAR